MIDQVDRELKAWVESIVTGVDVVLGLPRSLEGNARVNLYLLSLADPPPAWGHRHPVVRVALRYLVTAWAEDDEQAHALLGRLIVAVMEKHEYELDLTEPPASFWTVSGHVPRPAFTVCVPLPLERPEPIAKFVSAPLQVRSVLLMSLHGIVLGPGDIPIAGASVELPGLQLSTHTDGRGRFSFATVPADAGATRLRVKAKGRVQSITVEQPASDHEPLAIRFDSFEK